MPQAANITVKAANGTTDVVYAVLTPAGGDGSKAVFRQDAGQPAALPVGHRPIMEVRTVNNGPGTARRVEIMFKMPYATLNTTTGRYEATDSFVGSASGTLPKNIPAANQAEFAHQFTNLLASALMKAVFVDGYAPA